MSGLFNDDEGRRNWRKVGYHARSAFAVLLSLAVLVAGGWFVADKAHHAYDTYKAADDYQGRGAKQVLITIPSGATGSAIGDQLVENDVVKSRKAFLKAYRKEDDAAKIQAGTYKLWQQIPATEAVAELLDKNNQVHNRVTVPEGLWLSDQLALLSTRTKIPLAQYQAAVKKPQALGLPGYVGRSAEGFLFPNTYEIGQKPTATSVLKLMAAQYNTVAARNNLANGADALGRTPLEVMTVASIVQAEARPKDQAMVAGIIYNRLRQDMPLGLDSTAHYLLKVPMNKPLPSGFQKLQTESSYNTYANTGLPAGPIDAPGEGAIKAALHPTKSDYLYWLTVNFDTGETRYAKTQQEQNANEAVWKAWCKTAKNKSGCPTS